MLKFLFGDKRKASKPGKSVNQIRGRKGQSSGVIRRPSSKSVDDPLAGRIKLRRQRTLALANGKAALAAADQVLKPDIAGAIKAAQFEVQGQIKAGGGESLSTEQKAAIDRALRLKASARTIDDALSHPAWSYVAMAVIRGLLEEKPPEKG